VITVLVLVAGMHILGVFSSMFVASCRLKVAAAAVGLTRWALFLSIVWPTTRLMTLVGVILVAGPLATDTPIVAFSELRSCRDQLTVPLAPPPPLVLLRLLEESPIINCRSELLRVNVMPLPPLLTRDGFCRVEEYDEDEWCGWPVVAELKSLLVRRRPFSMLSYMRSC
jgi:hypothetical protein